MKALSKERTGIFSHVSQDALSSVVVFLVALPLCLGIAIATGYPPAAGLISGVIGGIVVGMLSGCPLQVSGPAAGLITIVWEAVHQFGFETVGVIVLLAGMIQVGMGFLGLGLWFRAVSPAVIQGMLAGIGVLIFSSQFHVMVDDAPKSSAIENLVSIPSAIQKGILPLDGSVHHIAALIGIVTISVLLLWNMMSKPIRMVPGALVAVFVATVMASMANLPINYVQVPQDLGASFHIMSPGSEGFFNLFSQADIWLGAVTMAFIASAETLLTATAVDQMSTLYRTNYNKEIIAQGFGNMCAGILGVLPITAVIVRSSANVQAGGRTRLSTIIHGGWILLFVLFLPFALELIPVASLAAILVYTGYKMMNVKAIEKLARFGKLEVVIYFATVAGIVMTNLLEGVLIGLGLSLFKHLYTHSHLSIEPIHPFDQERTHLLLKGSASFITLPKLATAFEALPVGGHVVIYANYLNFIDHACIEFLENWEQQYQSQGGQVQMKWGGMKAVLPAPESAVAVASK